MVSGFVGTSQLETSKTFHLNTHQKNSFAGDDIRTHLKDVYIRPGMLGDANDFLIGAGDGGAGGKAPGWKEWQKKESFHYTEDTLTSEFNSKPFNRLHYRIPPDIAVADFDLKAFFGRSYDKAREWRKANLQQAKEIQTLCTLTGNAGLQFFFRIEKWEDVQRQVREACSPLFVSGLTSTALESIRVNGQQVVVAPSHVDCHDGEGYRKYNLLDGGTREKRLTLKIRKL